MNMIFELKSLMEKMKKIDMHKINAALKIKKYIKVQVQVIFPL